MLEIGITLSYITTILYFGNVYLDIPFSTTFAWIVLFLSLVCTTVSKRLISIESNYRHTMGLPPNRFVMIFYFILLILLGALLIPRPIVSYDANKFWAVIPKIFYMSKSIPAEVNSSIDAFNAYPNFFGVQVAFLYTLNNGVNDLFMRILAFAYTSLTILLVHKLAYEFLKDNFWAMIITVAVIFNESVLLSTLWMNHGQSILFYAVGSIYFSVIYRKHGNLGYYVVAGMFVGMLGSVKYNALPLVLAIVTYEILHTLRNYKVSLNITEWNKLLYFISPFIIIMSLWVVRNIIIFENPVFPRFSTPVNFELLKSLQATPLAQSNNFNIIKAIFQYNSYFIIGIFFFYTIGNIKNIVNDQLLFIVIISYMLMIPLTLNNSVLAIARYSSPSFAFAIILSFKELRLIVSDKKYIKFLFIVLSILFIWQMRYIYINGIHSVVNTKILSACFCCLAVFTVYYVNNKRIKNIILVLALMVIASPGVKYLMEYSLFQSSETDDKSEVKYGSYYFERYDKRLKILQDLYYGDGTSEFFDTMNDIISKEDKVLLFMDAPYFFDFNYIGSDDRRLEKLYTASTQYDKLVLLRSLKIKYILDASSTYHFQKRPHIGGLWCAGNLEDLVNNNDAINKIYDNDNYKLFMVKKPI